MQHVFGRTFVCDTDDIAREITFNKSVDRRDRCRSVTLQGDVFDLAGTLEGGAPASQSSMLLALAQLNEVSAALEAKKGELDAVTSELRALSKVRGVQLCGRGATWDRERHDAG